MPAETKVVIRFRDGRTLKGYTYDFGPNRDQFQVVAPDEKRESEPRTSSGMAPTTSLQLVGGSLKVRSAR